MAERGSGGFALAKSLSHLLHRAQQFAADQFAASAGGADITLRQFALLAAVAEKAGQTQTDLVYATGIDRSTLADIISRMEDRGLVARDKAAEDKRAKAVTITSAGKALLNKALPGAKAADAALAAALPKAKQAGFMAGLSALAAAAAEHMASDSPAPVKPARKPAAKKPAKKAPAKKAAKAKPGRKKG
jgi:DNA-binding MarR family transcriptional regulator